MSFENTVGKGETAPDEQFLLFLQFFQTFWRTFCHFHQICRLQTLSHWKSLKFVFWERVNPFPNENILDSSKLKEFADDNFNTNGNGWKFSKRVENTVGKGEIALYGQFLLYPKCFQKTCIADR